MNELSVSDVLRKAVDVLAERGWHQGGLVGPDGERCAYGAILDAANNGRLSGETGLLFEQWLQREGMLCREMGVGVWNDDPARSYEDVVLAMKRCAADADLAAGVVAPPNAHTETEG